MGIPSTVATTAKGRAVRRRIVDSAARLILVEGVARTTLDSVGAEAAVGRSQLYHYFADKSDLVDAVIDRHADGMLGGGDPQLARLTDWGAWARWRDDLVEGQRATSCVGGCPLGSLASELSDVDERARVSIAAAFDRWEGLLAEGIATMRETGLLSSDADPGALAAAVLAAVQGGLLLTQVRHETRPLEAALDGAIALLRSFAPRDRPR